MAHIDSIRGIAALAVAWYHAGFVFMQFPEEGVEGDLLGTIAYQMNLGFTGVLAFFAISGFVICPTLQGDKAPGSRRFAISRFFRLYPAFWVSLAAMVLFRYLFLDRPTNVTQVLGNIPMLFSFIGVEPVINVYWTLEVELIFYFLCLVLFLLGWLAKPIVLFAVGLVLMACSETIFSQPDIIYRIRTETGQWYWPYVFWNLAIMFWGGLFRVWYDDRHTRIELGSYSVPVLFLVVILLTAILLRPVIQISLWVIEGEFWRINNVVPFILGLGLFLVGALFIRLNNRFLVWLGAISYSIYLLHMVAIQILKLIFIDDSGQLMPLHPGIYLIMCFAVTIVMSAIVYYAVEKPAIRLGRQLQGRSRDVAR
jgi:peptidoglycan/LPS O-acetylase OafA/YrhL